MNTTNRGLNRLVIVVTGLLVLVAGAIALALALVPAVASEWRRIGAQLADRPQPWVSDPSVGRASLLVLGIALVALVLIVLLLVFIARQGRGRTAAALEHRDGSTVTRIDLSVARALLEEHLSKQDELAGLRISAYEVRGTPMLKISAKCRRGVSPAAVADEIGRSLEALERVVGTSIPAFVQLTGGFRAGSIARPQVA